ncbi:MAG: fused response regulator/phosphatase [Magnetococcus sp. WYHC-3]
MIMREKSTVLVVDDSPEVLTLLDGALRDDYHIRVATSGEHALKLLQGGRYPVDLILLDIVMPGIDGLEVCRRIKAQPDLADIPVVFLTSQDRNGEEMRGLSLGAVDYVRKPVDLPILKVRVANHVALRQARRILATQAAQLSAEREVIENILVRMRTDNKFRGDHLRLMVRPLERTNGDICLAGFTPDGRQQLLVGDFTGHGLTAAIAGPQVKQTFYTLCAAGSSAEQILSSINQSLCEDLPIWMYMAAILVEVNPQRDHLRVINAGLPDALLWHPDGNALWLSSSQLPLGCELRITFSAQVFASPRGSRLLAYTDGLIEASNPAMESYGQQRLFRDYSELLARQDPLESLMSRLQTFLGSSQQDDDILAAELSL